MNIGIFLLAWTMLGGLALHIETFGGFRCGHSKRKERPTRLRMLGCGPIGWLLLAAAYILPRFVDSKVRT